MFDPIHYKSGTLPLPNSISRAPLRLGFIILPLAVAIACVAFSPTARAQLPPPPPDGGYPNRNTAEGTGALLSLTTGFQNTAIGFNALISNTSKMRATSANP